MKSFGQYLLEGLNTRGIKVPEPYDEDGNEVYEYLLPTDLLKVVIGPNEDGAHNVSFTHGGEFGKMSGVHYTPAETMNVLNHVAATMRDHSKRNKASEYTYHTVHKTRDDIYKRIAKLIGVNATNTVPEKDIFNRHDLK